MADLKFRFPYGSHDDPTREILLTLVDQGDGTFAPKISGAVSGTSGSSGGAPTDVNYLVGTASGDLSNEIVVGTTPGGELGGTWASPTVDATHSGSSHASIQTAAESTAAVALAAHTAAADPHTGYVLESLIDAAGDLIVGTADNTPGRLAIGATKKVLTSDGTNPSWGYKPFIGCLAYNSTTQAVDASTLTYITLDSEDYDTSAMHDPASNNSRVVAPITGYYRITGQIFYATTSAVNYILFDKNHAGAFIRGVMTDNGGASGVIATAPPIFLNANDYIEMVAYHTQAGTLSTGDIGTTPSQQNFLSLEFLGV